MSQESVSPAGPLRVLHVITGSRVGGAETMLCKLLEAAPPGAWDSRVLTLEGPGPLDARIQASGVPLQTLKLRAASGLLGRPRALQAILSPDWRPQLIQGWMYHGNLAAFALAQALRSAALCWNIRHALQDPRREKPSTALAIRANAALSGRGQAIICNSPAGAALHQAAGFSARNWHIIPNGFDLGSFQPQPSLRTAVRAALGLPEDAFVVGMMARFAPIKDHPNAIKAVAMASKGIPDLQFVLAGTRITRDNPALAQAFAQADLMPRTHLLGERQDVHRILQALDVLVSASLGESFPNVIGEALASGVPCVATDVGDTGWALGGHGVLVPPGSPEALSHAILALHAMGPEGRRQLGQRGRIHIEQHFTIARVAEAYGSLYRTLTER